MEYYYKDKFLVFKVEGKLHKKIILYNVNYNNHIKIKHQEMSIERIEDILKEPDYVYKPSRKSLVYYYEKMYDENTYRVVIGRHKIHTKEVVTAYKVDKEDKYTIKHVYCVYDKETFIDYKDMENELENDIDYFYEIFNIAE